jgi:hypothetical protein
MVTGSAVSVRSSRRGSTEVRRYLHIQRMTEERQLSEGSTAVLF